MSQSRASGARASPLPVNSVAGNTSQLGHSPVSRASAQPSGSPRSRILRAAEPASHCGDIVLPFFRPEPTVITVRSARRAAGASHTPSEDREAGRETRLPALTTPKPRSFSSAGPSDVMATECGGLPPTVSQPDSAASMIAVSLSSMSGGSRRLATPSRATPPGARRGRAGAHPCRGRGAASLAFEWTLLRCRGLQGSAEPRAWVFVGTSASVPILPLPCVPKSTYEHGSCV
jgi:hypothetical protein